MVNQELTRQLRQLEQLIQDTLQATSGNLELQAHWARYLCVRVAGFIENSLVEIYGDFARSAASEPVANFATSRLSRIRNPKKGRFVEISRSFKGSWIANLESFLAADGQGDAIDSIMTNRHLIAHGKSSGITVARVKEYLAKSVKVIDFIEDQCSGKRQ